MPRPDGRIEPGQPLRGAISARAWNRAQDAADIVLGANPGTAGVTGSPVLKPYTWVYCKPSVTVARWGVLAITGVAITPTSSSGGATASFEEMPVLTGDTPEAKTTAWCVAVEPIESGKIGKVAVGGVVQAQVNVSTDSFLEYVKPRPGTTTFCTSAFGTARILWLADGGYSTRWAIIQLGCPGGIAEGEFYGRWDYGTAKTVNIIHDTPDGYQTFESFSVTNRLVSFIPNTSTGVGKCLLQSLNGGKDVQISVVAFNLTTADGYNANGTSVLGSQNGGVKWITPNKDLTNL
jgi:hypothetical protein